MKYFINEFLVLKQINPYKTLPDTVFMSEILRPCLTAGDEGDGWGETNQRSKQLDFTAMFDMHLFSFNYNNGK